MSIFNQVQWGRGDSNPHVFRHAVLSRARLPIPALPQRKQHDPKSCCVRLTVALTLTVILKILFLILKIATIIPKYQPSQLWPALLCASPKTARVYNIITDNAGETFASFNARVPSTLPEYIWAVMP